MQLSFTGSGSVGSATTSGFDLGAPAQGVLNQNSSYNPNGFIAGGTSGLTPTVSPIAQPVQQSIQQNTPGGTNWFGKDGRLGTIIGGVEVLGSLWNSYQQHKMAREQMNFAREQWDTNLANQTQTYNTALEDRIRARHNTEGRSAAETTAYLDKHSL